MIRAQIFQVYGNEITFNLLTDFKGIKSLGSVHNIMEMLLTSHSFWFVHS